MYAIRSYYERIWKSFTEQEKTLFMSRLRHLWGVARHRIPLHSHDKIQQLRIDGKLHINSGRLINFEESKECIEVIYFDKKEKIEKSIKVVITSYSIHYTKLYDLSKPEITVLFILVFMRRTRL